MPHAFRGIDAHIVTAPACDRDITAHVLQVEGSIAPKANRPRESLGVLGPTGKASSAALTALSLEPRFHVSRDLVGLALDMTCDLIDLALDLTRDLVGQILPVTALGRRRLR